jgi:hypothetical protein
MTDQHRATTEQWEYIERYADSSNYSERYADSINYSCILELRARIEALEAAQQPRPKPPTLKEQALGLLNEGPVSDLLDHEVDTSRRALEALPE